MKVFTIITGILLTIVGIFCLFVPRATFASIGWLLGLMLVISGVSLVIDYIALHRVSPVNGMDLLFGILGGILGVFILLNQPMRFVTEVVLVYMVGVWLVVGGIIRIVEAVRARKTPGSTWGWSLVMGILLTIAGAYSFIHPMVLMFAIGWLIAFYILLAGIDLLSFGIGLHKVEGPMGEDHWTTAG